MDPEFLLSSDGGATVQGPISLSLIRSLYLSQRIPDHAQICPPGTTNWQLISTLHPEWTDERERSHDQLEERIEESGRQQMYGFDNSVMGVFRRWLFSFWDSL